VRLTWVLVTVGVAVALQVALAPLAVGGRWAFDLVLVGCVYAALHWGPVAGIASGTVGGLLQDLLSGDIVGLGALAKTVAAFLAGVVGTQVVLNRSSARTLVLVAASLLHRFGILALRGVIDQQWPSVPWNALMTETAVNAACGFLAFQGTTALPGLIERQRMSRRSSLSRRQW
jgi:rod shape-determining protein MreD